MDPIPAGTVTVEVPSAAHFKTGMAKNMNRLRVKCVKCGKEWTKDSVISWGPDDISSSLCDACFGEVISPIIHKRQLSEGNLACFGKASTHCDQAECRYRQWCVRMEETQRIEGEPQENITTSKTAAR
jgi:hypothetical protein